MSWRPESESEPERISLWCQPLGRYLSLAAWREREADEAQRLAAAERAAAALAAEHMASRRAA